MDITGKICYNSDGETEIIKQLSGDEVEMHFPAGGREANTPWQNLPGETNILRHRLQW